MERIPTEAQEATTLVAYLRLRGFKFTHVSNETGAGNNAKWQGIRNKRQGLSKGFPDYLVIVDDKLVAIELKRLKRSRTTPEQLDWLKALSRTGAHAIVAHGAKEAIDYIETIEPVDNSAIF